MKPLWVPKRGKFLPAHLGGMGCLGANTLLGAEKVLETEAGVVADHEISQSLSFSWPCDHLSQPSRRAVLEFTTCFHLRDPIPKLCSKAFAGRYGMAVAWPRDRPRL